MMKTLSKFFFCTLFMLGSYSSSYGQPPCKSTTIESDPMSSSQLEAVKLCNGGSPVKLTAVNNLNAPTYAWRRMAPASMNLDNEQEISVSTEGKYRVIVSQTDPDACKDTAYIDIVKPYVADPADVTLCANQNLNVDFNGTPPYLPQGSPQEINFNTQIDYNWEIIPSNPGGIFGSNSGNGDISNLLAIKAGTATFRVTPKFKFDNNCFGNSEEFTVTVNAQATISTPPNGEICKGGSYTMSVTLTGATTPVCTWEYENGPDNWQGLFDNPPVGFSYENPTSANLRINTQNNSPAGNYKYRCRVNTSCGSPQSGEATLTLRDDPSITSQPAGATICAGGQHTMSVTAGTGGIAPLTYQWKYNGNNVVNGTPTGANYSNQTTSSMTVSGITATGNHSYTCMVSTGGDGCGAANSSPAVLIVNPDPTISISNTSTSSVCNGGTATLKADVPSALSTCTVAWQNKLPNGWVNLPNGNQTTCTTTPLLGAQIYRVLLTCPWGGCDQGISAEYTVNITTPPIQGDIDIIPTSSFVCNNQGTSLSVANVSGCTIAWEKSTNGTNWTPAGNGTTISTGNLTQNTQFRVKYACTPCGDVTSNPETITVNPAMSVTIAKTPNTSICPGESVELTANATGGASAQGYNYAWSIAGAGNTNKPKVEPLNTGSNTYSVTVTDKSLGACTTTGSVSVDVKPSLKADISVGGPYCVGATINLNVTVSNGTATMYTWVSPDGTLIPAVQNPTLQNAKLTQSGVYRVTASGTGVCAGIDTLSVVIHPEPTANITGSNFTICKGQSIKLSATTTAVAGVSPSYQWQLKNATTGAFVDVSGATSADFTTPSLQAGATYRVRVTFTAASNCDQAVSSEVPITVVADPNLSIVGSSTACKKQVSLYNISTTSFKNDKLLWTVSGGNIIKYFTDSTLVAIEWGNAATTGVISVTQTIPGTTTCEFKQSLNVTISNNTAADTPASMDTIGYFKPNNILICKDTTVDCYQWGYFDVSSNQNITLSKETFQAYGAGADYKDSHIYWVQTWKGNCLTPNCPNTIFNRALIDLPTDPAPKILLFPNPNTGAFRLEVSQLPAAEYQIEIFDAFGRLVKTQTATAAADGQLLENVLVENKTAGLYFVVLRRENAVFLTRKFTIFNR